MEEIIEPSEPVASVAPRRSGNGPTIEDEHARVPRDLRGPPRVVHPHACVLIYYRTEKPGIEGIGRGIERVGGDVAEEGGVGADDIVWFEGAEAAGGVRGGRGMNVVRAERVEGTESGSVACVRGVEGVEEDVVEEITRGLGTDDVDCFSR